MAKEKYKGSKTSGEFLHIVDEIQIFLEHYRLTPYSEREEAEYNKSAQRGRGLPSNKLFWAYEIDETEGNRAGSDHFFGFVMIYITASDGVRREIKLIEIPSTNSFPAEGAGNRYRYDIVFDTLANEIWQIRDLLNPPDEDEELR